MESKEQNSLEKIRQQFEFGPYPATPVDTLPNTSQLYIHNLVTSYYLRNQEIIDSNEKLILDAGCGTGYKSLILALANPGAKIVGIDLSETSVELAGERFQYHDLVNAEFYPLSIYEIDQLGLQFDYINCDEVLTLLPDPTLALKAMKSVLKPNGIIRTNLHSLFQRELYFRAQKVFKIMGLMEQNPEELEIEIVREIMEELKNDIYLKQTWRPKANERDEKQRILMNYLLANDRGYTIPDMFQMLREADLEFISMVNRRQWDLRSLFKDPNNLPAFLAMSLPEVSVEDKLHLYELLYCQNRLLDFWCGHPNQAKSFLPIDQWTRSDWQKTIVHLHPQFKTSKIKDRLIQSLERVEPLELANVFPKETTTIDHSIAAYLLPLFQSSQSFPFLVQHWQKLYPLNPVTLDSVTEDDGFNRLIPVLSELDYLGYILLEHSP